MPWFSSRLGPDHPQQSVIAKNGTTARPIAVRAHCSVRQLDITKNAREQSCPIVHFSHNGLTRKKKNAIQPVACLLDARNRYGHSFVWYIPFGNLPSQRTHKNNHIQSSTSDTNCAVRKERRL